MNAAWSVKNKVKFAATTVVLSEPTILRPRVRFPSKLSMLFTICNFEVGIGMIKGRK